MATRYSIGLASGTSVDGVDAALCEMQGIGLELRARLLVSLHQHYSPDLRDLIRRASATGSLEARQAGLLHRLLGETFAAVAMQAADRAGMSLQQVQCIGCPGHTIGHDTEGRFPGTLSLGMPAVVAERTGLTTVGDFRPRDLVVGGQGALLMALPDFLLFRRADESRVLIHLGGMAHVVYLPAGGRPQGVLGFEAGPCNLLLDGLIRKLTKGREEFDAGGKHAVQGHCQDHLLQRWLAHPYFHRRPPRSMSRPSLVDEFIAHACQLASTSEVSTHDLLCTATHLVARAITSAARRFLPEPLGPNRVLLSGGGVRNGLLWHLLEQQFAGSLMEKTDANGIPADSRKAIGFAVLAVLTLDGVPANLPAVTGAAGSRLLGSLTPGSPANWSRCLAWMSQQIPPRYDVDEEA